MSAVRRVSISIIKDLPPGLPSPSKRTTATFDFSGKKILVTGASRGIGRSLAIALCKSGAQVYAMARNAEALNELEQEIGPALHPLPGDVTMDSEQMEELLAPYQPFDGLVNNAGIAILEPAESFSQEVLDRTFAVNVRGPLLLAQSVARGMRKSCVRGSIVNVSSQAGLRAFRQHLVYCSSKAALDMATKVFALEMGAYGIRVNSVNPTVVLTDMGKELWGEPSKAATVLDITPLGRFAEEEEVVNATLFLLSDAASMTTGLALPVDGGCCTV